MNECRIYSFMDLFVEMVDNVENDEIKSKGIQKILLEVTGQVLEIEEEISEGCKQLKINDNLVYEKGMYFIPVKNVGVVVVNEEDLSKIAELLNKEESDG